MALAALVKWVQFAHFEGRDWLRQLVVGGVLALAVVVVARRRHVGAAHLVAQCLATTPPSSGSVVDTGWAALAVVMASAGYLARWAEWRVPLLDRPGWQAGVTTAALVPLAVLAVRAWRRRAHLPPPERLALWTVGGGIVVWVALVAVPLARSWPLGDVQPAETLVVTALGEEIVFRGLLLVLALAAGWSGASFLAVSVGFGLWHLPDAFDTGFEASTWVVAPVTFLATFLAAQLVLTPLRLRAWTIVATVLLHAAVNIGLASFYASS